MLPRGNHDRWLSALDKHPIRTEYCVNCIDHSICSNQKHSTYQNNPWRNTSAEIVALRRRWSVVLSITYFRLTWNSFLMFDFAVITLHKITDYNLELTPKTVLFSRSHCNSWHGWRYGKLGTSDVSWVRCTLWLEHRKCSRQETGDDDYGSWACTSGKIKLNVMQLVIPLVAWLKLSGSGNDFEVFGFCSCRETFAHRRRDIVMW